MAKTDRISKAILFVVLAGFVLLLVLPVQDCFYKSVNDTTPLRPFKDTIIKRSSQFKYFFGQPAKYLIKDGQMYLLVFEVKSNTLFLAVFNRSEHFTSLKELKDFSENNPKFNSYWPDKNSENLGVKWLPVSNDTTIEE